MAAIRIFISVLRSQIVTSSSAAHGDRRRGDQENAGTRLLGLVDDLSGPGHLDQLREAERAVGHVLPP